MHREPDNPHIPGVWYEGSDPRVIKQVADFIADCDDWTKALRAHAGSSVFRAHPGIKSVMITDMAGLDWLFDAPPEELDRLNDGDPGFGGLSFNKDEMLEGVTPALVDADRGNHTASRALVARVLRLRAPYFAPACQRVLDYGVPLMRSLAPGKQCDLAHALHEAAIGICFEWLFGITHGPSGDDAETWLEGCFGLKTDNWLTSPVARAISRAKNGPRAAIKAYSKRMHDAIRASEPYPEFVEIAREVGVPEQEVAGHLMFAAAFNGTAGAWAIQFPTVAQVYVDQTVRRTLHKELQAFSGKAEDLDDRSQVPFLDDLFLESVRLYGRPRHYVRRALVDTAIPRSEGPPVPIAKGTTLTLVSTVARQDRTVFGDDGAIFDPFRYGRQPELRERIKPFGPTADARNTFGCVGHAAGVSTKLWKTAVAAIGRELDWRITPWPVPDPDAFPGVNPRELYFERL